jgi:hypothetical protein
VRGVAGRAGPGEQAGRLGDGQRDHARVSRGRLARLDRGWRLGIGAAPEQGGGDGADGQGGHDQHGVPGDRGVKPDLGLIQPEGVLAGPESLFSQPPLIPVKKKSSLVFRVHSGRY